MPGAFLNRALLTATMIVFVTPSMEPARANPVIDWNIVAIDATAMPPNSVLQSRTLAILHGAIFDAVHAVTQKGPAYAIDLQAPPGTSIEAAVAMTAHDVLVQLVPMQQPKLDQALGKALAQLPDGSGRKAGMAIGGQVAERSIALRKGDHADAKVTFTPKPGLGLYQPTPPDNLAAILAHWGGVTPFALRGIDGFAFAGAPDIHSAAFARDFNEVKALGARNSPIRTADQTAAAIFWTVQTAVPWHAAARAAAAAHGLSISETARLFAMLSMATADSQILAFAEKYARPRWRPITAIREAAALHDDMVEPDPDWAPLLGTPPHPEYPSAHSVFSGAAEAVLQAFFDSDQVDVSVTSPPVVGVTRTYKSFSQMTKEVGNARIWGGIHFRSAVDDGVEIGRKIGSLVAQTFPRPRQLTERDASQPMPVGVRPLSPDHASADQRTIKGHAP
jgi:hypothetical protein